MKAVVFLKHGDESVLELANVPDPEVGARDVRVKVHAVALNHLDLWVRKGLPGLKVAFPHIPGADVAGTVESVGAEVKDLQVGAEVVIASGAAAGTAGTVLNVQQLNGGVAVTLALTDGTPAVVAGCFEWILSEGETE